MNPVHRAILEHIRETSPASPITSFNDDEIIHRMFSNQRGERGMRLTQFGLQVMQCFFKTYDITVPDDEVLKPKHLVMLDEKVTMPYYFDKTHIVVFDHVLGIKLRLVSGRLSTLLEIEN